MVVLLLLVLIIAEIGFAAAEMSRASKKREWSLRRLSVNVIELAAACLMLLLPGIDFGFRFKGLFLILGIRILTGFLFWLANRKKETVKKNAAKAASAVLSAILLAGSLFPAFVFKDYTGRPVTGSYRTEETEVILIDPARTESFEKDGSLREVPVHFYFPADIDSLEAGSLPLVIFSHGAFGYYQSNTSTYMELASHGYVVASLDHPYHAFFTRDSSGKTITVDPGFIRTALNVGSSDTSEAEVFSVTSEWISLREADMNFVIDTLESAAAGGSFDERWFFPGDDSSRISGIVSRIDIRKIGLMGHSLGGAASVTVGRRSDISAVIDLDGTMLGEETGVKDGVILINEEPYPTPILCLDSESHHNSREEAKKADFVYANNVIMDHAEKGYDAYFSGAAHMNFTDLPLLSPFLARMLGTGSVDPEKCIDQVNAVVLRFFDCFLKESGEFTVDERY